MPEFKSVDNLILLYVFKEIVVNSNVYYNTKPSMFPKEEFGYMNLGSGRERWRMEIHIWELLAYRYILEKQRMTKITEGVSEDKEWGKTKDWAWGSLTLWDLEREEGPDKEWLAWMVLENKESLVSQKSSKESELTGRQWSRVVNAAEWSVK